MKRWEVLRGMLGVTTMRDEIRVYNLIHGRDPDATTDCRFDRWREGEVKMKAKARRNRR